MTQRIIVREPSLSIHHLIHAKVWIHCRAFRFKYTREGEARSGNIGKMTRRYTLLGPCPSRGALVSRVGSLSHDMHSACSAYFVFVSSTVHLGLIVIFSHHGNLLATMVTDISLFPLFFNNSYSNLMPKKARKYTQLARCCTFFFVAMATFGFPW